MSNVLIDYLNVKFGHNFTEEDVKALCWLAYIAKNPEADLDNTWKAMVGPNDRWDKYIASIANKTLTRKGIQEALAGLYATGLLLSKNDPNEKNRRKQTITQRRQYFMDCILTKVVIPMLHETAFEVGATLA